MRHRTTIFLTLLALLGVVGSGVRATAIELHTPAVGRNAVLLFEDGDLVVFGLGGDGASRPTGAKGSTAVASNGPGGYRTFGDVFLLDHYEVRLIRSKSIESVRPHLTNAARDATAAGASLAVLRGTAEEFGPSKGQIDVIVSSKSPCGGSWLACGGPNIDEDGLIHSGRVWVNPRLLSRDVGEIANTMRHELGHTLGLAHFDGAYEGAIQIMHSSRFDATDYRAGDANGIRRVSRRGSSAAEPAPAEAPAPEAPRRAAFGDFEVAKAGSLRIDVGGWAVDDARATGAVVLISVDGATVRVTADRPRDDVAAAHPGHGRALGFTAARIVVPGAHEVCVTIDSAEGPDIDLGCRSVDVLAPGSLGVRAL